jgi:hypothetical protein
MKRVMPFADFDTLPRPDSANLLPAGGSVFFYKVIGFPVFTIAPNHSTDQAQPQGQLPHIYMYKLAQ